MTKHSQNVEDAPGAGRFETDNIMKNYRPATGTSAQVFLLKRAFYRNRIDQDKKKPWKQIYDLKFFSRKLEVYKNTNPTYSLHLAEYLINLMQKRNVSVDNDYINNEDDLEWIRSIPMNSFLKLNLDEEEQATVHGKLTLREGDGSIKAEVKRTRKKKTTKKITLSTADPSTIKHLQVRLRRVIKNKLLATERGNIDSSTMKEFVQSLQINYDESDVEIEDCFSSLYNMHRDVAIFDLVKATVLENFTGNERQAIEKGNTWNSFITAIRYQSVVQAIKILEIESYTTKQNGDINNMHVGHTTASHDSIRVLTENMYALKISERLHFDSENDRISRNLLQPAHPVNQQYGELDVYKESATESHRAIQISNVQVMSQSAVESSYSLETTERDIHRLNEMELEILAKVSKKKDTIIMTGLFVKLCRLQNRPRLKLQLSKKEFTLIEKYKNESVGVQTFSLLEEGRLKMPVLAASEISLTQNSVEEKNDNLYQRHETNANSYNNEATDDVPTRIYWTGMRVHRGGMRAYMDSDSDSD